MERRSAFESYSRSDKIVAAQIEGDLVEIGLDVWRDERLSGGQEWWDTILASIRSADVFVVVVSDSSLESVPCARELEYADALGKHILPIRVDRRTSPKLAPPALASKEWLDYEPDDKGAVLRLVRALQDMPPGVPLPDPLPPTPDVPLSYTTNLAALVHRPDDLTVAEQHSVLFQLREGLRSKADQEECATLLALLRTRRELLATVAAEIDRALSEWAKQSATRPNPVGATGHPTPGQGAGGSPDSARPQPGRSGPPLQPDPAPVMQAGQPRPPVAPQSGMRAPPTRPGETPPARSSVLRTLAVIGGVLGAVLALVVAVAVVGSLNTDPGGNGPGTLPVPNPVPDATTYGDDPDLDVLWDDCTLGGLSSCDLLYLTANAGTDYEAFGGSCGDRGVTLSGSCADNLPFPYTYGDDPDLDSLEDDCLAGDMGACDALYFAASSGSAYEEFGGTCGNLVASQNGFCTEAAGGSTDS